MLLNLRLNNVTYFCCSLFCSWLQVRCDVLRTFVGMIRPSAVTFRQFSRWRVHRVDFFRRLHRAASTSTTGGCEERNIALGIDFGTESVRIVALDFAGELCAPVTVTAYRHGVIEQQDAGSTPQTRTVDGLDLTLLPNRFCLQHSLDWLEALDSCCRELQDTSGLRPEQIASVGVSFTSSTVLPCASDGTPLHQTAAFHGTHTPHAWFVTLFCSNCRVEKNVQAWLWMLVEPTRVKSDCFISYFCLCIVVIAALPLT